MRTRSVIAAAAVAILAAGTVATTADAQNRRRSRMRAAAARPRPEGQFATPCRYSHTLSDDPIVRPGQPGASHSHDFFANTTTDAYSTLASLQAGGTTCRRPEDTAAYWAPSVELDGAEVVPMRANIYYTTGGKKPASIMPFPAGLKVVAGDGSATTPQDPRITTWSCEPSAGTPGTSDVPSCSTGTHLVLHVRFPDCWNGADLDSADHRSHLAYSARGRCPSTHRVPVPKLSVNIHYPTAGGAGVRLSSGSQYSGHADFFNAWQPGVQEALVRDCINANVHCGPN